jgi:hypothetical protein
MNDRIIFDPATFGDTEEPARNTEYAHRVTSERQYGTISVNGWVILKPWPPPSAAAGAPPPPPVISAEVT